MGDLVTGAAGFIGSHLARALAAEGRPVRGMVRATPPPDDLPALGVEIVAGDLGQTDTLANALDGVERVFHCAAMVADWGRRSDFERANVTGVANLLAASHSAGVQRFVHLSTTDVYGFPAEPASEQAPLRARGWPYNETKIAGERLVWSFGAEHGLPVTVIRPANVYGVGSHSLVYEVASLLRSGHMFHLGSGDTPAGLCHVHNLVDCILLAAAHEGSVGEAYNVTDDSRLSWRAFTDGLAGALGAPRPRVTLPRSVAYAAGWCMERTFAALRIERRPLLTRMAVELLTSDQAFSIAKARSRLGFEPKHTFESALPEMAAWLGSLDGGMAA